MERLSQSLSLESLHELSELLVCASATVAQMVAGAPLTSNDMSSTSLAKVEFHPVAVKVKGWNVSHGTRNDCVSPTNTARREVLLQDRFELFKVDRARCVAVISSQTYIAELYSHIEYRESQLVVGIGLHCQLGIGPQVGHKPFSALPISMWLILLRLNSQVSKTTNSSNDTSPLLEVSATRNTRH